MDKNKLSPQAAGGRLQGLVRPCDVRLCKACSNLVTTEEACPLCKLPTGPHPGRNMPEDYCIECGGGPFPADNLHVKTWDENPYCQTEDGDLATVCEPCHAKEEDADDE